MKDGGDSPKFNERKRALAPAPESTPHESSRGGGSIPAKVVVAGSSLPSVMADEVAAFAASERHRTGVKSLADHDVSKPSQPCDVCEAPIEGEPAGRGLYFWSRGGELRFEEPGLCEDCATAIVATASRRFEIEEEEG